ncbi:hypothetical protein ROR02_25680 [Pararhodospirillum oryzae]|uniref:Tetratricopeptide repeat protein n=1 Tax=Pararhodospirillum oryzae TaxID=478448 RepID=A0A512HAG1_9PROT|nr:hypothetical protein ROR02_25680 [Pararhodospirillum oryzae]
MDLPPPPPADAPPLSWIDHAERLAGLDAGDAARKALAHALDGCALLMEAGTDDAVDDILGRALRLGVTLPAPAALARARALLGRQREVHGDVEGAHGHYLTALDLFEGLGDRAGVAAVCDLLAILHVRLDDSEGAETYWRYALSLVTALEDRAEEARLLGRLGTVAFYREDWHAADELLREALVLEEGLDNRAQAAQLAADLARLEEARGDLPAALEYWLRVQRFLTEDAADTPHPSPLAQTCAAALARLEDALTAPDTPATPSTGLD